MLGLVVIVVLFATVIVGTVLGRRYRVGPPVLLISLGALLGLIPQFGHVRLDGEIVLLLFLPAILYWESLNTSFREIRANMRIILLLSVGLVIANAVAVAWTARAFGMESHAASVLGAVLSPTDAAAVAGLAKKLPRRTLTVLRAESIINDGTALVLFAVAVNGRDRRRAGRPARPDRPFHRLLSRRDRRGPAGRRRRDGGLRTGSMRRRRKRR